jgi:hypothetical protein
MAARLPVIATDVGGTRRDGPHRAIAAGQNRVWRAITDFQDDPAARG